MNIVVFTQGVSPIVKPILEKYGILAIVESAPRGSLAIEGRTKLADFSKSHGIPYYWLSKATRSGLMPFLSAQTGLQLAAVYSMSQLLPEEILKLFPLGVINAHPSLLPAYRGPNPYFRMFYDGAKESGITIHYLDKGEDTGDIILQEKIQISRAPEFDFRKIVNERIAPLMLEAVSRIKDGTVVRRAQPKDSPTARAANVTKDNVEELIRNLPLKLEDAAFFYQNTLGMLPLKFMSLRRSGGDWQVARTIRLDSAERKNPSCAVIRLSKYGWALAHPEGLVVLKLRIGFVKFALKFLRDCVYNKCR